MSKTFRYRNSDSHRRTWGRIQRPDGRTLELDADESVDLEQEIEAAYLESVDSRPKQQSKSQASPVARAKAAEQYAPEEIKE